MPKSNTSNHSRKPALPPKPYPDFPLYSHRSGRWAKKVRNQTRFYGRWATTAGGKLIPVDDITASAAAAKLEFERCWPYHSQGREAPPVEAAEGCTILYLCNAFLTTQKRKVESGEQSQHTFAGYQRATDSLMAFFGGTRRVDDLTPKDFEDFRDALAKKGGVVTLKSKINRLRVIFKYASDRQLIERPVGYGGAFDRPSTKALRKARNAAGEKLFERDELLAILDALDGKPITVEGQDQPVTIPASAAMRAMVLLGLNAGFGNTDCATLPRSAVNLDLGWITFPRPKTGINRRIPLWPETVEAMRLALAQRPTPTDPADADLCFITSRGTRYVRMQKSGKSTEDNERFLTINSLSRRFETIMEKLGIGNRRGVNFYTLRHVFETQAGECLDQVAVDACMGHVDTSMAAEYRQRISDDRLRKVVNTVRDWLWPGDSSAAQ